MAGRGQTIVVGYDGTEGAKRALDRAADLVGYGTSLVVVNVSAPYQDSSGRAFLDDARGRLNLRLLTPLTLQRVGEPVEELIAAAKEVRADLLIVGDGKRLSAQPTSGSVSTKLVHEATCDVLVVR